MKIPLNFWLALALFVSAFFLVTAQNRTRELTAKLNEARREGTGLKSKHEQLKIELSSLAGPARIQKRAENELSMIRVTPQNTVFLKTSGHE